MLQIKIAVVFFFLLLITQNGILKSYFTSFSSLKFYMKVPAEIIWTTKYLEFKREFENMFNIYFSFTYDPYPLRNQPNQFHEGTYDVRFQSQFLCT